MKGNNPMLKHPLGTFRLDATSLRRHIVLVSFIMVSILLFIFHPGGIISYIFPSTCWTFMALMTIYLEGGLSKVLSRTNSRIAFMALLSAAFQIFIMIDAGLINGFGNSPLSFEPTFLFINFIHVTSTLLGMELSRGYLVRNLKRKKPTLSLVIITALYTLTNVSIGAMLNFKDPLVYSKYMGKTVLPTVTGNLLATYAAQIGGPLASLAYQAPLKYFKWFSPILPNLPWGYESIIGVMTPTIGFVVVASATKRMDLLRAGIISRTRMSSTPNNGESVKGWLIISIFFVMATWASTGLLGFYPTVIASGSMRPTMDVGDMAIVVKVDPKDITAGDIIQYWNDDAMFLHRVLETYRGDEGHFYVTKGDANSVIDIDPVYEGQIKGKLIFTLPKIGWISIYLKRITFNAWSYLKNNVFIVYSMISIIILSISYYVFHNQRNNRMRIRMKRRW